MNFYDAIKNGAVFLFDECDTEPMTAPKTEAARQAAASLSPPDDRL